MRLTLAPELIEAARCGRDDGIERLLEALWPHAYRIARSIVHDDCLAEDAAQEACAIVYRDIRSLRTCDAFRAWMYRIVVREALRVAKKARVASPGDAPRRQPDIEARLDALRALAKIAPGLRAVVILRYYAELTSPEIAQALQIPAATVRFRLAKARQLLAPLLQDASAPLATYEVCHD